MNVEKKKASKPKSESVALQKIFEEFFFSTFTRQEAERDYYDDLLQHEEKIVGQPSFSIDVSPFALISRSDHLELLPGTIFRRGGLHGHERPENLDYELSDDASFDAPYFGEINTTNKDEDTKKPRKLTI